MESFNEACINCGEELYLDHELNEGYCDGCLMKYAEASRLDDMEQRWKEAR